MATSGPAEISTTLTDVTELKNAMGFDGDFVLPYGTRRDRIRLLGNGVCPPVMEAVSYTHLRLDDSRG